MTRFAFRAALLALLAPLAAGPALGGPAASGVLRGHPALKRSIVVSEEFVRIGDLIEQAGPLADVPVFRAPDLGMTGSIPTARVLEAIRPHHLFGVDTAGITDVEVTRAGRTITPAEIEARIAGAFAGQFGLGNEKDLTLSIDREMRSFTVEPAVTGELQVARAHYEPRTARFDVTFELPGSVIARRAPLRFTGKLVERAEVMVLVRALQPGEIARAGDFAVERRPKNETPPDAIRAGDPVAGLAARRPLRSGQPIRRGDLAKPDLIKRDDTITLVYEAPGILLTTRGKALESGADGDLVSAVNVQSKRTVQGVVTGPGRITLSATMPRFVGVAIDPTEPAQDASGRKPSISKE